MKTTKAYLWSASLFLLVGICPNQGLTKEILAPLQVTIVDENGSLAKNAHIYIFSRNKKKFFGTREAHGTTVFDLPAGDYRVYAGLTVKANGFIDHYSSPEAKVRVSHDEPASVILNLQQAVDPEMILSDTARQKMGIDEEIANNLN